MRVVDGAKSVVDVVGAKGQPGDNEGTDVPQAVVDGGETGAVLRMGELGEKHRRGNLGEGVAKAQHGATAHECIEVLGGGLENGTDDHDNAADDDGGLAAEVVGKEGAV